MQITRSAINERVFIGTRSEKNERNKNVHTEEEKQNKFEKKHE